MKLVIAIVCCAIVTFVLLVFVVDRFVLSPGPRDAGSNAPVRSR